MYRIDLSLSNTTCSSQAYKLQTSYVPDLLSKQAKLINCKNMVGCNQILNSQLCCSPAVFLPFRVVKLSLLSLLTFNRIATENEAAQFRTKSKQE